MDAVPIYNVNPGAGSGFNGWEAMALLNNNRNNSWGDGGGYWWIWILLLFGFWGWGGNGWGGNGGRGGCGCCCNSGIGALGADLAITDATNIAEIKAGLNYTAQTQVGQTNLMGQIKDNMFAGFANLNNAVTNSAFQNQLGQRDLQAQIASCCCNTQSSIAAVNNNITQQFAQLNYNNAMQTCEVKQAIAAEGAATRALINAQYTQNLERQLAESKQQLFVYEKFGRYANNGCCNSCNSCGCACATGC